MLGLAMREQMIRTEINKRRIRIEKPKEVPQTVSREIPSQKSPSLGLVFKIMLLLSCFFSILVIYLAFWAIHV